MLFTSSTARSRARRLISVLAVAAITVTACSNSSDGESKETTTTAASTETTAGSTETTEATDGIDIGSFEAISGVAGVSDDDITFAVLGTGPNNPMGYCLLECYAGGVQAYFDYRNSLGGIHGRELKTVAIDDELGLNQVKALEIKDSSDYFGVFFAPVINAGIAEFEGTDIPVYTTYPNALEANGNENIYMANAVQCTSCNSPMTTQQATIVGATKAAVLALGVSQASKDCADRVEREMTAYGPDNGVEFVYKNAELPFGFTNGVGPEVTAMKDLGVDFIVTCVDQNSVLVLEQELERQGLTEVYVTLPQGYGDTEYLKANEGVLEGSLLATAYMPFEATVEGTGLSIMKEWLDKSGVVVNDYAIQGWLNADLAVAGLLAAGPQFDRAKVVAASNTFTDWSADGIVPPVDWTTAHNAPADEDPRRMCMSFLRIKNGAPELVGDPAKPFYCFEMPMTKWVDAVQSAS